VILGGKRKLVSKQTDIEVFIAEVIILELISQVIVTTTFFFTFRTQLDIRIFPSSDTNINGIVAFFKKKSNECLFLSLSGTTDQ
jgi:hypothetical protein